MDLHEWEILSDDGLLDCKEDDEKKIVSGKRNPVSDVKIVFDMNYFLCPSMDSRKISQPPGASTIAQQPVPVPIQLDSPILKFADDESVLKDTRKVPIEISVLPSVMSEKDRGGAPEADQDTVTQVFFKKMKENEFVDMKMDSPRSSNVKGTKPQIDVGNYQFDDPGEAKEKNLTNSPRKNLMSEIEKSKIEIGAKEEMNWDGSNGGLNILKWSLHGIGAIFSFGFAAATVCILFYGGHGHHQSHKPHQKLRFQIYTDDKKLKQVVQQATRLNEAISAVRGVPLSRAQITCGGYYEYDGL